MAPRHPGQSVPTPPRPVWSSPASSTVRCTATVDASRRRRLWPRRSRACRCVVDGLDRASTARPRLNCTLRQSNSICTSSVEDAIVAHQRPKLERYGETLFVVLRAARYLDESETVDFGELHIFCGPTFVLTVRHSESPDLSNVRDRMESDPELLKLGPSPCSTRSSTPWSTATLPSSPTAERHRRDRDRGVQRRSDGVASHLRTLARVVEFQPRTKPLLGMLRALSAGFDKYQTDEELQKYLRDVTDHATMVVERCDGFRNCSAASSRSTRRWSRSAQNERCLTSRRPATRRTRRSRRSRPGGDLFAPTLIGTVYGMNFENMPSLNWAAATRSL